MTAQKPELFLNRLTFICEGENDGKLFVMRKNSSSDVQTASDIMQSNLAATHTNFGVILEVQRPTISSFLSFFLVYEPVPLAAVCSADRHAYGGGKGKKCQWFLETYRSTQNYSGMWRGMKAIIRGWEDIIRFINALIHSHTDWLYAV